MATSSRNKLEAPVPADVNTPEPAKFSELVDESKMAIHEAEMVPPKIGPRKRGPYKKRQAPGDPASPSMATSAPTSANPGPQGAPDVSKLLIEPIRLLSTYPARRADIPDLAFNRDECVAAAQALNEVMTAWLPQGQVSPKTASVLMAGVVFGSILISKMQIYNEVSEQRRQKAKLELAKNPDPKKPFAGPEVNAVDYFRPPNA